MVKFYKKLAYVSLSFVVIPFFASAATISIVPASGTYEVGDIITAKVVVSSSVSLNAVSARLLISPTFFSIQSISKVNSTLDFWVTEPSFDRNTGIVNFEGVALSGFVGSGGTLATLQLKVLKAGSGKLVLQSSQILANDGEGTDITGSLTGANYDLVAPVIKVPVEQPVVEPKVEPIKTPVETIETPQPLPSLKAPEIVSGTKYGALSIVGSSEYPKAQVLLTFVATDGSKVFIISTTDDDGSYNIVVPNSLKHGNYEVSAVIVKADKSNSEKSNTVIMKIGSVFSDIDPWVNWMIVLLLIVILYLFIRIYQHLHKDKSIHSRLRHEAHKAENITHKTFDILREDITDFESEKSSSVKHKLSSEIKKDIDSAEKVIEKEIKDIESV